MKIKLYRNHLLIIAMAVVGLFYFLNRLNIIYNSDFTTGVVIGVKEWTVPDSKEIYQTAPVIRFEYKNKEHVFTGEINTKHDVGENLIIIIKNKNPEDVSIYDFTGFWLNAALYCIIPLLLFCAIILSLVGSERYFVLSFGKNKTNSNYENSFLKHLE